MTKKACFRLTIRNVNEPVPEPPVVVPDSFRLTIRNVNCIMSNDSYGSKQSFRLTIRNVNYVYKTKTTKTSTVLD